MEITLLLEYSDRSQLRTWLQENHSKEKECWVVMSRSKTPPRRKKSHWTKLNMDRCTDLEDRGLMTPAGRRAFEETKL